MRKFPHFLILKIVMSDSISNAETPTLLRRLAAIVYDLLLIIALLVAAVALIIIPLGIGWDIKPEKISSHPLYQLYLLSVIVGFYCWFWLRGGQTTGMRAWRFKLVRDDGKPLRLIDALLRQLAALLSLVALGIGFLWSLWDAERLTWHDRLTGTRLVMLEKPDKK